MNWVERDVKAITMKSRLSKDEQWSNKQDEPYACRHRRKKRVLKCHRACGEGDFGIRRHVELWLANRSKV